MINSMEGVGESLVVQRDGKLVALVQMNDNIIDWNLEGEDKFIEELEARQKAIVEFVNSKVSKFSKIRSVEIQKEPFVKTATHKIKRFLYEKDKKKRRHADGELVRSPAFDRGPTARAQAARH